MISIFLHCRIMVAILWMWNSIVCFHPHQLLKFQWCRAVQFILPGQLGPINGWEFIVLLFPLWFWCFHRRLLHLRNSWQLLCIFQSNYEMACDKYWDTFQGLIHQFLCLWKSILCFRWYSHCKCEILLPTKCEDQDRSERLTNWDWLQRIMLRIQIL